jgi:hypothetical protein
MVCPAMSGDISEFGWRKCVARNLPLIWIGTSHSVANANAIVRTYAASLGTASIAVPCGPHVAHVFARLLATRNCLARRRRWRFFHHVGGYAEVDLVGCSAIGSPMKHHRVVLSDVGGDKSFNRSN